MPSMYLSKKEVDMLYSLVDNQTMLGQLDYSDEDWEVLSNLQIKLSG